MDKQHVLIAEDELALQPILRDALEEAGFSVTLAASAEEATERLERPDQTFAALVTDINLSPAGLTGWDVARRARELNGALPVIYMTGAAAGDWPANGVPNSILVTKPFAPAQIITALSQLLNVGGATAS
ncbi:MAG TPA: response regulator [Caulobacteraceae bacterium]|nr:response regulator [Caulobacteraceae bacterium]